MQNIDELIRAPIVNFKQISFKEAMRIKKEYKSSIILDVRTEEEFNVQHLEDAVLLPYDLIPTTATKILQDKEANILIYCRAGRRSVIAAHLLGNMGYKNVYEFGGITLW